MTETKSTEESPELHTGARRRRSKRIHIAIPVVVRATSEALPVNESTRTLLVNAHGCLVTLAARLETGQQVYLVNPATKEEALCTVTFLGKKEGEAAEVGLEFKQPSPFFWRIHFPPEDWNPEDRKLPQSASVSYPLPRK
jgi:hypothetical protein